MSFELSDSGKEWLSSTLYIDDDLEWLDEVALRYDGNMKSKAIDLNMTASLNDDDLMEINVYMDEDKMQFMIPDLSDYVLKYDMVDLEDTLGNTSFLDMTEMNSKFADAIPDSKQLKKVTDKYIGIFVDNINDVEKSSDEVSAEDITKINRTKLKIMRSLDLLVIDEISMVRADVLDAIDTVLRRARSVDRKSVV